MSRDSELAVIEMMNDREVARPSGVERKVLGVTEANGALAAGADIQNPEFPAVDPAKRRNDYSLLRIS